MNEQTKIPPEELKLFQSLPNLKVVFDVGARTDIDYLDINPEAEYHLFEPNPEFFEELKIRVGDKKNVFLNNYGLGDITGEFYYHYGIQGFSGAEHIPLETTGDIKLPIRTLDEYVKEKGIKQIDFLKIDTEGMDYKVLCGGKEAIKLCRYIQYEHWNNKQQFHELLNEDFWMLYIGGRNVLCQRK